MIAYTRGARTLPSRFLLATLAIGFAGCGGGGGGGGGGGQPTGPVTISGKAQYEFPPPRSACQGLNFTSLELRPIRQATVEVVNAASEAVLDSTVTDDNGDFALTVDPDINVFIRVRAELKKTGSPSWDVEVRDNTAGVQATPPTPLLQRALYVLDGAAFNSGTVDSTRDITGRTGWNASTSSYTGTRAAAPFAILDTVYAGIQLVLTADASATFAPLDVFWSVNNTATPGEPLDIDAGELGTSFFSSDNQLFLLGKFDVDADEFDDHVVAHEWGHYFENNFSRSDSIGGSHGLGELLDMRVAFGEGSATALSGIVLANPTYCDTSGFGGFGINIEGQGGGALGWYNEISVMKLVYDLWDSAIDGMDSGSIGFGPIYSVMTGAQATTPAFTSIFTFAAALKAEQPAAGPFIDDLLEAEEITSADINAFGEGETNDAGDPVSDVLPVFTPIAPDGTPVENICSNSQFDRSGGTLDATGNKLSEHRYLRMTVATPGEYDFSILTDLASLDPPLPPDDPDDERDQSDPDVMVVLNGQPVNTGDLGFSGVANEETFTLTLAAGEYVLDLVEFRYQDEESLADYPARTCFDVTVSQAP